MLVTDRPLCVLGIKRLSITKIMYTLSYNTLGYLHIELHYLNILAASICCNALLKVHPRCFRHK